MQSLRSLVQSTLPFRKERSDRYLWDRLVSSSARSEVDSDDGDESTVVGEKESFPAPVQIQIRTRTPTIVLWVVWVLAATTVLYAVAYYTKRPTDRECDRQLSVWSPLNEIVEYEEIDFVNPFAHDTIYRGPPTPELEDAWADLWFYDGIRIPEDKIKYLNRSGDLGDGKFLKPIDSEEGGYHALFEVFHQLHCLNLIRQYTWRDYYHRHPERVSMPSDLRAGDVGNRMHVDHCIEALRISLMCHADTTPYLIINDPTAPHGQRADFSPHHKCRKFEPIRQWTIRNQLSVPDKKGLGIQGDLDVGHGHDHDHSG